MDADTPTTSGNAGGAGRQPTTVVPNVIVQQPGGFYARFGKLIFVALIIAVLVIIAQQAAYQEYFASGGPLDEQFYSGAKKAQDKIALIRIEGMIIEPEGYIKRQIDAVRDDESVKAVVLRIDSPGGTVTASDYLYHHLKQMADEREIPVVVSMGGTCASGGYYLAMVVGDTPQTIYAEPSTWTGSIGVVIPHFDFSGLLEQFHVVEDGIVSGQFKQIGHPARTMSEPEREILQSLVNDSFESFKEVVQAGRPQFKNDEAALDAVADGRIFSARQAQAAGLVNQIGFIEEAIDRASELANLDGENVRVVDYKRVYTSLSELILSAQSQTKPAVNLGGLVDLASPRSYYLWSWLPEAMANTRR